MSDLDEIAEAGEATSSTDLASVTALAMKQLELEAEVASKEAALAEAKSRLDKVQLSDLPNALKAACMKSFELADGRKVVLSSDLKVSVPKKNKDAVIAYMTEWGYGANVNNVLTVDLGKGNDNAATALAETAKEMGLDAQLSQDIATGTVKKALNRRLAEGKSDDLKLFGAYEVTKTTVS